MSRPPRTAAAPPAAAARLRPQPSISRRAGAARALGAAAEIVRGACTQTPAEGRTDLRCRLPAQSGRRPLRARARTHGSPEPPPRGGSSSFDESACRPTDRRTSRAPVTRRRLAPAARPARLSCWSPLSEGARGSRVYGPWPEAAEGRFGPKPDRERDQAALGVPWRRSIFRDARAGGTDRPPQLRLCRSIGGRRRGSRLLPRAGSGTRSASRSSSQPAGSAAPTCWYTAASKPTSVCTTRRSKKGSSCVISTPPMPLLRSIQ